MIYNDVTLNYKPLTESMHGEDFSGECNYEFNQAASDFIRKHYKEEHSGDYPDMLTDQFEQMDIDEDEGCIYSTDADGFILMMNALEYAPDDHKPFEVDCYYEHIIWLFHDLSHVMYDSTDFDIEVHSYAEQTAITKSIELCIENKIAVPWGIIRKSKTEFLERFKEELHLGKFEEQAIDTNTFTFSALS